MVLTEVQKQELQKAFSVFDRDGSGSVTKDELALVLKNLHPSLQPTLNEVNKVMDLMDKNKGMIISPQKDGLIQFEEFLEVMEQWLLEEEDHDITKNKRKREDVFFYF